MCQEINYTMRSKLKRTLGSFLPVDNDREGERNNCGACCHLPFRCAFLQTKGNKEYCSIYKIRPLNCRKFPRTNEELSTVKKSCGFTFNRE